MKNGIHNQHKNELFNIYIYIYITFINKNHLIIIQKDNLNANL